MGCCHSRCGHTPANTRDSSSPSTTRFVDTHCRCLFCQSHLHCLSYHQICFTAIDECRKNNNIHHFNCSYSIKTHSHHTIMWCAVIQLNGESLLCNLPGFRPFRLRAIVTNIVELRNFVGDAIIRGTAAALELPDARHAPGGVGAHLPQTRLSSSHLLLSMYYCVWMYGLSML